MLAGLMVRVTFRDAWPRERLGHALDFENRNRVLLLGHHGSAATTGP
jgi:hypothetical protein